MNETEVKLSKHERAAITDLEKSIEKKGQQLTKVLAKITSLENEAETIRESISGLREVVAKLKGE